MLWALSWLFGWCALDHLGVCKVARQCSFNLQGFVKAGLKYLRPQNLLVPIGGGLGTLRSWDTQGGTAEREREKREKRKSERDREIERTKNKEEQKDKEQRRRRTQVWKQRGKGQPAHRIRFFADAGQIVTNL